MGGKKILITVPEEEYRAIETAARTAGILRVSEFVKSLAIRTASDAGQTSAERKIVPVEIDNYREIAGYVAEKKFGRIESFATFAMGQYMSRFPLTDAQKERAGKITD